jgi:phenylpropionate dioxygenase-like ring-hydroxylating dioxygenase large terminal subunit
MSDHAEYMHAMRRDLCRRAVEHARGGTTDLAPDMMHNDVAAYVDPERYAREHKRLFREMPQVVCLSSDLPEPGSYQLFDDTGTPIVVIRGKDGLVRAFLNICPHRGARLVRGDMPKATRVTCRFHGWTFDAEGRAIGVPQEAHFCGRIDAQKHLVSCPAEERHGVVFVQATPGSRMDLDAHLGTFGQELEMLDLTEARAVKSGDLSVSCNWKYALDTYFENYHFATLHRNTLAGFFVNNLSLYDSWGLHHRLVFPPKETYDWIGKPESEWLIDTLGTPYFIFPNTIIFLGSLSPSASYVTTFRLFPQSVGEMTTRMTTYAPRGVNSPEHRAEIEAGFQAMADLVAKEDYSVTGESWRNFASMPPGSKVAYGRQEIAVQNFHRKLDQVMAAAA